MLRDRCPLSGEITHAGGTAGARTKGQRAAHQDVGIPRRYAPGNSDTRIGSRDMRVSTASERWKCNLEDAPLPFGIEMSVRVAAEQGKRAGSPLAAAAENADETLRT